MQQKITFTNKEGRDVDIVCRKSYNKGIRWLWLLKQSIQRLGLSRSIVVDKNNNILCGTKQAHIAAELGIKKARVIETTGDELIIVKRIDVDSDSAKSCEISLTDNLVASKMLSWDVDLVISDMSKHISFDARKYEGYECITKELDVSELLKDEVSKRPKKIEEAHRQSSSCHSLFLFD